MIYCLCYISKKSESLDREGVRSIVRTSKKNNDAKEITGVLVEYKSDFLQYLEGDPVEIYKLFNKIKLDERHYEVNLLQYSPLETPLFSGWAMVYRDLDSLDSVDRNKYNQCIETIEEINDKRFFWKGIKAIEILSNLIES